MTAETIAARLDGRRVGGGWMARCPVHHDRTPSLSLREVDGRLLVCCHAGCSQDDVIAALRARGLWAARPIAVDRHRVRARVTPAELPADDAARRRAALSIWDAARPAPGTLVQTYLFARKLDGCVPDALRFHPSLRHPGGHAWPAMVALVTHGVTGAPLAVHRTFLAADGCRKAPVAPAKMMLGPCRAGVVRLGVPMTRLMVGEGIETSLAGMFATGEPVWAALSASGMTALALPPTIRDVIILADGDEAGEAAAQTAAARWSREGRLVRIARPPQGMDFNDVLTSAGHVHCGGAR
ncbi:MAG: virulence-associated protein E [Acidimicrobiia bacterium]|nr:virulence-associated protein E [Acidimicrobiia bacterium]